MKIALIKPPATYADWYQRPLLGIAYLASYLEKEGFRCAIFDSLFFNWDEKKLLSQLHQFAPDVAAFTAMTHEIGTCARVAKQLKDTGTITVIGGCHLSARPRESMEEYPAFDYGVIGEGEKPFQALMQKLKNGEIPSNIPGLVQRTSNQKVSISPPGPPLSGEDLDQLPFPAFHLYYGKDRQALAGKDQEYPIISGRGCPYHCAFCMQALGREVRRRSAQDVCLEMEAAINNFGAHTFNFIDEIFLTDNIQVRELLERFISSGLNRRIRWSGLTRANLVSRELVALAKKAGCFRLEMGVESGDDEILQRINKEITVKEVRTAAGLIKAQGIELNVYFILGNPGETPKSIALTRKLAVELNPDNIALGIMVPYPGTEIYRMASRGEWGYRLLSHNWELYDKYGGGVLEVNTLSLKRLQLEQQKILLSTFLFNHRYTNLVHYIWKRRHALRYFIWRRNRGSLEKKTFPG